MEIELEKRIEAVDKSKVSWAIFIATLIFVAGLMAYFQYADARLNDSINKNEDRFYKYQQDQNDKYESITNSLARIQAKLGIDPTK